MSFSLPQIPQASQVIDQGAGLAKGFTVDLLKAIRPFFMFFVVFLAIDYLVYLWDNSDFFASWRTNDTADQIRSSLDLLFGDSVTYGGRAVIIMLAYACVTYATSRMYGKSVLSLAGPVTLALFAFALNLFLRLTGKYNGTTNRPNDSCWPGTPANFNENLGCETWQWMSYWSENLVGMDSIGFNPILVGMAAGFLTAVVYRRT